MNKIAYIFPGQGSQFPGMGKDLYEKYPAAKAVFDQADKALGMPLSRLCFEGPEEELTQTVNAQPALLTMSIACLEALKSAAGAAIPDPDYMAGHSLGEYTALTAAGSMKFTDAVVLARERGRLMYEAGQETPGAMAAIIAMSRQEVEQICSDTGAYIANLNCPGQIAISGTKEAVKDARKLAKEKGAKLVIPLQVSGAFHCPLMKSASDALAPKIQSAEIAAPAVPVIGNTQAQMLTTESGIREELSAQVCSCVQWEETLRYLDTVGVDTFVEIGPGKVLAGLVGRTLPESKTVNIGTLEDLEKNISA